MFKIYSEGHPHLIAGKGETVEESLINFFKNNEDTSDLIKIVNMILKDDYEKYISVNGGEETLRKIQENGAYGPIVIEPKLNNEENTPKNKLAEIARRAAEGIN